MNKTITLLILGVIFLALLLMLFNAFRREERQNLPVALPETTRPQAEIPPARVSEAGSASALSAAPEGRSSGVLSSAAQQSASRLEAHVAPSASATVKTVPAQIDPGQAAPAAPPPQASAPSRPAPPKVPAMPETSAKQRGVRNITNIVVYTTQEGATLRLGADAPLECTSRLWPKPDRLAVDCLGQWNDVKAPTVPQNKFIKAVRVGKQAAGIRFVIDLHQAPAAHRLVQTSPRGLDVRLR